MKSNLTGSLSRTDFVARLRNLADEIESGALQVEDETLHLPEYFEITQTAAASQRKASYALKLDWSVARTENGSTGTTARKRITKKTSG